VVLYTGTNGDKSMYTITSPANTSVSYFNTGGSGSNVYSISCSRDGTFIAIGLKSGGTYGFYILNGTTTPEVATVYGSSINSVRVSDDNNFILVPAGSSRLDIYARFCGTCPPGHYANKTDCKQCSIDIVGCFLCKNSSLCYSCYTGYYV